MPVHNYSGIPAEEFRAAVQELAGKIGCAVGMEQCTDDLFLVPPDLDSVCDRISTLSIRAVKDMLRKDDEVWTRFTGWKPCIRESEQNSCRCYVAQFLCGIRPNSPGSRWMYVNLPGIQNGRFVRGGIFDIGHYPQRISGDEKDEEIVAVVLQGFEKLSQIVRKETGVDIKPCPLPQMSA